MKLSKIDDEMATKMTIDQIAMHLVLFYTSDPDDWRGRMYDLNVGLKAIKKKCYGLMKDEDFLTDNFYN